jgi:hypothetical protein
LGETYFILLGLLSLFLLLPITGCSDNDTGRQKKKHLIQEGNYIKFKMGGHDFKVEKGFVKGSARSHLGILSSVSFWALLPNFETYDKSKNYKEFVEQLGYGRRIWIRAHPPGEGRNSLKRIFERGKTNKNWYPYSGRLGSYDEMQYGLEVYYSHTNKDDQYLYYPNGEIQVMIECSPEVAKLPSPGCDLYWDYSDKVFVTADFSKQYLPRWRSIVANIKNILDGKQIETEGE